MEQEPCSISILLSRRDNSFLKLLRGMKGRGSILKFGLDEKKKREKEEKKKEKGGNRVPLNPPLNFHAETRARNARPRSGYTRERSEMASYVWNPAIIGHGWHRFIPPPEIYRRKLLRTSWELVVGELSMMRFARLIAIFLLVCLIKAVVIRDREESWTMMIFRFVRKLRNEIAFVCI